MLQKVYYIFFFLLLFHYSMGQSLIPLDEENYVNQLSEIITSSQDKTAKTFAHLRLSEYWSATDSLKSRQALNQALALQNKQLPASVYAYYQGYFHTFQGDKNKAKSYFEQAINDLDLEAHHLELFIKSLYHSAYIQVEDKGYDVMVKTLTEKCIPLCQKKNQVELLAFCYTQLGLVFMSVGKFDTAEEYHKKALEQLEGQPEWSTVHLLTYLNLVSNYCYKPDSKTAEVYLNKAKKMIEPYQNSIHYANYYYQEAMLYTTIQNFDKALKSLEKGVQQAKENHQPKLLHMLYFRMYNVYLMQKDYVKAKNQLEHILQENILNKEIFNRRITYTQLAAVNNVLGHHQEAYEWMKKSANLSDSLQQSKILEKMNELDVLHQTAEKQQTIDQLELEKRENELLTKNKNLRITLLAIGLMLSLVIALLIYRNYSKQRMLNQQINMRHQQDLLHIENERKHEAIQAILQGEEQERQRIAQDLHDSIGGMLAHIRMSISKEANPKTGLLLQKIDKSIVEMRRISRNLMPETLKNLGLEIALRELCEAMSQEQLYIQFEAFNLGQSIPFETQLALYRITQESISNVIKYAQANTVIVQVSQNETTIHLTIEDDGIGFDPDQVVYGLGIQNIKNRTTLINGTFELSSEQGKGTTLNIECHV